MTVILQMLDLKGKTLSPWPHQNQALSQTLYVTHAQTETDPSLWDTVGCIIYSRFTRNIHLCCVLCANLKKTFSSYFVALDDALNQQG